MKLRLVECRHSDAVQLAMATRNLKHPLHTKINFGARFQLLLHFRNGWNLIQANIRNQVLSHTLDICVYIASCQVAVKFYMDPYFEYSPRYHSYECCK